MGKKALARQRSSQPSPISFVDKFRTLARLKRAGLRTGG